MNKFAGNIRSSSPRDARYAEWLAIGALVAGSVGAVVGATRSWRHRSGRTTRAHVVEHPDPATMTAPHGDKLLSPHA